MAYEVCYFAMTLELGTGETSSLFACVVVRNMTCATDDCAVEGDDAGALEELEYRA